jgi:hypothetical protein
VWRKRRRYMCSLGLDGRGEDPALELRAGVLCLLRDVCRETPGTVLGYLPGSVAQQLPLFALATQALHARNATICSSHAGDRSRTGRRLTCEEVTTPRALPRRELYSRAVESHSLRPCSMPYGSAVLPQIALKSALACGIPRRSDSAPLALSGETDGPPLIDRRCGASPRRASLARGAAPFPKAFLKSDQGQRSAMSQSAVFPANLSLR